MKAVIARRPGPPEVLVLEQVPDPVAGPGQVLVRVESASVNFADVMRRRGDLYPFPTPFPFTPGGEVAGTVAALGDGLEGPSVGTPVLALVGADGSGGYAQYAVADARQVIPIPPGVATDEAAAIVVAGVTAQLILVEVARLQPGETVLVEGAGGGMGQYAVQLAKHLGATVIGAVGGAARADAARAAGADHVLRYSDPGWARAVRELTGGNGADVIIDIVGGSTSAEALTALAPFGRMVVAGHAGGPTLTLTDQQMSETFYSPALGQSLHAFNLGAFFGLRPGPAVASLQTLVGLVAGGAIRVPLGETLPLREAAAAHQKLEARSAVGKIILKPW